MPDYLVRAYSIKQGTRVLAGAKIYTAATGKLAMTAAQADVFWHDPIFPGPEVFEFEEIHGTGGSGSGPNGGLLVEFATSSNALYTDQAADALTPTFDGLTYTGGVAENYAIVAGVNDKVVIAVTPDPGASPYTVTLTAGAAQTAAQVAAEITAVVTGITASDSGGFVMLALDSPLSTASFEILDTDAVTAATYATLGFAPAVYANSTLPFAFGFTSQGITLSNDDAANYIEWSFDRVTVAGKLLFGETIDIVNAAREIIYLRGQAGGESYRLIVW